jgi:ADP-ribose pyrophosphatase
MNKTPKRWKKLSSDILLEHDNIKISLDQVELPNGATAAYVRHAPVKNHAVIVIALNGRRQILIQREYSYPSDKVMWQLPGGSMEADESPETAALRELAEESGYSAQATTILGSFYTHNRFSDRKQYIVLCTSLFKHQLAADEDEFIESHWVSQKKLREMLKNGEFDNINLLAALNIWFYSKRT